MRNWNVFESVWTECLYITKIYPWVRQEWHVLTPPLFGAVLRFLWFETGLISRGCGRDASHRRQIERLSSRAHADEAKIIVPEKHPGEQACVRFNSDSTVRGNWSHVSLLPIFGVTFCFGAVEYCI